jgi:hypothetical protein
MLYCAQYSPAVLSNCTVTHLSNGQHTVMLLISGTLVAMQLASDKSHTHNLPILTMHVLHIHRDYTFNTGSHIDDVNGVCIGILPIQNAIIRHSQVSLRKTLGDVPYGRHCIQTYSLDNLL